MTATQDLIKPRKSTAILEIETTTQLHISLFGYHLDPKKTPHKEMRVAARDMTMALQAAQQFLEDYEARLIPGAKGVPDGVKFYFKDYLTTKFDQVMLSGEEKNYPVHSVISASAIVAPVNQMQIDHLKSIGAAGVVRVNVGLEYLPHNIFRSIGDAQPFYISEGYDSNRQSMIYNRDGLILGSATPPGANLVSYNAYHPSPQEIPTNVCQRRQPILAAVGAATP